MKNQALYVTSCDQGWSELQQCFRINPAMRTQTCVATGTRRRMWRLGQWVGCARARRPELEMLEQTESRDFRNYCQREEALRDIPDNHRHRKRRLRIDKRNLLHAPGLRPRDESVAYDILAYLGGAKVLAKVMSIRNGEGKQHCHA